MSRIIQFFRRLLNLSPAKGSGHKHAIMKFKRKAREVDAIQWTGQNFDEVARFTGEFTSTQPEVLAEIKADTLARGTYNLADAEDIISVLPGDWIARSPEGVLTVEKEGDFVDKYTTTDDKPIKRGNGR